MLYVPAICAGVAGQGCELVIITHDACPGVAAVRVVGGCGGQCDGPCRVAEITVSKGTLLIYKRTKAHIIVRKRTESLCLGTYPSCTLNHSLMSIAHHRQKKYRLQHFLTLSVRGPSFYVRI